MAPSPFPAKLRADTFSKFLLTRKLRFWRQAIWVKWNWAVNNKLSTQIFFHSFGLWKIPNCKNLINQPNNQLEKKMKSITLYIATLVLSSAAFASPKANPISVSEFEKAAQEEVGLLANFESCNFSLKDSSNGFTLSITDRQNGASVQLAVVSDSLITLEIEQQSADGSAFKVYTIKNQGSMTVQHVDDAYDHVYLTNSRGKTAGCEIDYWSAIYWDFSLSVLRL